VSRCFVIIAIACPLGAASSEAIPSPPTHKSTKPHVSLRVPSEIDPGASVLASGRATPASGGGRVRLELKRDRSWRSIANRAPRHHGVFSFRFHLPSKLRATRARAVLFVHGKDLAASPVRTIRVRRRTPKSSPPGVPGLAPGLPQTPEDPLSAASLMATIERYASRPDHLSDTTNGAAALDEFSSALGAAGLRLGQQAFTYPRFSLSSAGLIAGGASVPSAAIAPYLYSGTTGPAGVTAPLFDGGNGAFDASKVAGKIVVVSLAYQNNSGSPNLYPAIEAAVEGGAKALVGVTQGVGDYPKWEDSNARRGTGPMPVLLVGKLSGAAVIAAAQASKTGTVTLTADTSSLACERDVWGELEGADPGRRVFIGTPASSFTPSASEHGTAYAVVIGLARHYAALPKSARPETLVFMAIGGHEIGWLGLQALLNSPHASWFQGADAYVHLGSGLGAPSANEEPDGSVVTAPIPDPSGQLHNSENPLLETSILADFAAAGVPTKNKPPHEASGGEQTYAYAAGIPMVSFSGASLYFHTAGDVPSVVSPTILAEDADAFRRSVDTITEIPPGQLKAANTEAETYAESFNPDDHAPVNPTLLVNRSGGPAATPVSACP
jgi:hypothetical protein